MSSRAANVVFTTSLAAIAILAIGVTHYSPSHAKLGLAVFQLLIGFGLLTALFAVFPSSQKGGARFDRAADFSRMSLEVRVSRPLLMRCGMLAFGIGLLGKGLVQLSGGILSTIDLKLRRRRPNHEGGIIHVSALVVWSSRVTFKWKDYRIEGRDRYKRMTLATHEFIRRFLIYVLPHGFHRIRHYGLFASAARADNLARARQLLAAPAPQTPSHDAQAAAPDDPRALSYPCPSCGGEVSARVQHFPMIVARWSRSR